MATLRFGAMVMRTYYHMAIWTLPRSRRVFDYRKPGNDQGGESLSKLEIQRFAVNRMAAEEGRGGAPLWSLSAPVEPICARKPSRLPVATVEG